MLPWLPIDLKERFIKNIKIYEKYLLWAQLTALFVEVVATEFEGKIGQMKKIVP